MQKIILIISLFMAFTIARAQDTPLSLLIYKGVSAHGDPLLIDRITCSDIDSLGMRKEKICLFRNGNVIKEYLYTSFDSIVMDCDKGMWLPTIWKTLSDGTSSKMKDYLFSFNQTRINEKESIPGYVGSWGQTVYLDSVMVDDNLLWRGLTGYLNDDSHSYVALVLEDQAYEEGYRRAEENFKYYPVLQGEYFLDGTLYARDSLFNLRETRVNCSVLRGLFFPASEIMGEDNSEIDYYTTVGGDQISKSLVKVAISKASSCVKCSNGWIYELPAFPYLTSEIWQKPIVTEAENPRRLCGLGTPEMSISYKHLETDVFPLSPLSTDYQPGAKCKISNGQYAFIKQAPDCVANVTYGVANTLSGKYDVWVTFIPSCLISDSTQAQPSSVCATIKYCQIKNNRIITKTHTTKSFSLDEYAVTRKKMAEGIELGICYDDFLGESDFIDGNWFSKRYGFSIMLTNTTNLESNMQDHNLYIDCIELVPHKSE